MFKGNLKEEKLQIPLVGTNVDNWTRLCFNPDRIIKLASFVLFPYYGVYVHNHSRLVDIWKIIFRFLICMRKIRNPLCTHSLCLCVCLSRNTDGSRIVVTTWIFWNTYENSGKSPRLAATRIRCRLNKCIAITLIP